MFEGNGTSSLVNYRTTWDNSHLYGLRNPPKYHLCLRWITEWWYFGHKSRATLCDSNVSWQSLWRPSAGLVLNCLSSPNCLGPADRSLCLCSFFSKAQEKFEALSDCNRLSDIQLENPFIQNYICHKQCTDLLQRNGFRLYREANTNKRMYLPSNRVSVKGPNMSSRNISVGYPSVIVCNGDISTQARARATLWVSQTDKQFAGRADPSLFIYSPSSFRVILNIDCSYAMAIFRIQNGCSRVVLNFEIFAIIGELRTCFSYLVDPK